jgi:hypothetical protein
LIRRCILIVA